MSDDRSKLAAILAGTENFPAPSGVPVDQPDPKTIQEEETYEKEKALLEIRSLRLDLKQRKKYANKIFSLIVIWLACILVITLLQGFGFMFLSDNVLVALLGGTTINVLGLFIIVAKYIFYRPK